MEQGRLSEHACNICHAGPEPDRLAALRSRYGSLDDFRPRPSEVRLSFSPPEVPEMVTMGVLAEKYAPVSMPHRRHLERLMEVIDESRIARHFHGHEDVVCQGCHHHSPIGRKPPLCESCHGEPFEEHDLMKPGLYGAYHRQCIGCHQSMNEAGPVACTECHETESGLAMRQ
jgi:hypothetical protein